MRALVGVLAIKVVASWFPPPKITRLRSWNPPPMVFPPLLAQTLGIEELSLAPRPNSIVAGNYSCLDEVEIRDACYEDLTAVSVLLVSSFFNNSVCQSRKL